MKIRRSREGDEEQTLQFLNSVFPNWGDDHKFRWKFKEVEGALGRKAIAWVVEDAGKIVGHLAFIPMDLRVGNQVLPVCQLVDGAVSPLYRGRGIYTSLVREVRLDAERNGNAATFSMPRVIGSAYRGFRTICSIARMFKILSLKNAVNTVQLHPAAEEIFTIRNESLTTEFYSIPKRQAIFALMDLFRVALGSIISCCLRPASLGKPVHESKVIEVNALGTKLEASWTKLSSNYKSAFERNGKYLKWRYSRPKVEYEAYFVERSSDVAGYVIIGVEELNMGIGKIALGGLKIGYIMDLVAERDLMIPLLLRAEEELKKRKVCLVNCWTIEDTPLFKTLRSMRYNQIPKELAKVTVVANVNASQLESAISSENAKAMLISLGDTDHV
ncbi:GNAT family N-acetyltransferase [Candidatus Bathyarchaeota archaeon]|nr:GNAT family N-acetyltransferase [Candidatus Bathyarchaeota archaeon]